MLLIKASYGFLGSIFQICSNLNWKTAFEEDAGSFLYVEPCQNKHKKIEHGENIYFS